MRECHLRYWPKVIFPYCYEKVFKIDCLRSVNQRGITIQKMIRAGLFRAFYSANSCFAPLQSLSHGGIFLWRGSIRIILGFVQFLSTATVIDDPINHGVVMLQTHSYYAHSGCNLRWTIPHRSAWSGLFVPFLIYSKPVSDPTPRGARRTPLPTWVPRFAAYRKK